MHTPLSEVVAFPCATIEPSCLATQALDVILRTGCPDACVIDDHGQFLGIVTDTELLKASLNGMLGELQVEQIMHRQPRTLTADQTVGDAVLLFRDGCLSRIPVLRDGCLIGVLRRADVLRQLSEGTASVVPTPRFAQLQRVVVG